MKIVPIENYNFDFPGEDGLDVAIEDVTIRYVQPMDTSGVENQDDVQELVISTRDSGSGRFLNIKTESWSIDSADSLVNIINDFIKRAEIV